MHPVGTIYMEESFKASSGRSTAKALVKCAPVHLQVHPVPNRLTPPPIWSTPVSLVRCPILTEAGSQQRLSTHGQTHSNGMGTLETMIQTSPAYQDVPGHRASRFRIAGVRPERDVLFHVCAGTSQRSLQFIALIAAMLKLDVGAFTITRQRMWLWLDREPRRWKIGGEPDCKQMGCCWSAEPDKESECACGRLYYSPGSVSTARNHDSFEQQAYESSRGVA